MSRTHNRLFIVLAVAAALASSGIVVSASESGSTVVSAGCCTKL